MKSNLFVHTLVAAAMLTATAEAGQHVTVTADLADRAVEQVFDSGDIVPVTLYVTSEGRAAIFGVDFSAAVTTDDVRIRSVTFNQAFPQTLGRTETTLPAKRYRAVRVQPMRSINRSLGTDGEPIPFATVELEVLNDGHFEAALEINARCALVGVVPESTTVLGIESTNRTRQRGKIEIVNTRPEPDVVEPEPWTEEEVALTFEVRPIGGGDAVTVLTPNTTYELYYKAGYDHLNDYMLAVLATSTDQGLAAANPPAAGEWSVPEHFDFYNIEAEQGQLQEWGIEGDTLTHLVFDFWLDTNRHAGPEGHLCDITTQSPGELKLALFMTWSDYDKHLCIWMRSVAEFTVQESPDDDGEPEGDGSDNEYPDE